VYLGEIGMCVGLVLAAPRMWNLAMLVVVLLGQMTRMRLEERALASAFPEYRRYAAGTPRLVPGLRTRPQSRRPLPVDR
jgi:protein-S-isoprenylcysteine O-methyltransferase Ste14